MNNTSMLMKVGDICTHIAVTSITKLYSMASPEVCCTCRLQMINEKFGKRNRSILPQEKVRREISPSAGGRETSPPPPSPKKNMVDSTDLRF